MSDKEEEIKFLTGKRGFIVTKIIDGEATSLLCGNQGKRCIV